MTTYSFYAWNCLCQNKPNITISVNGCRLHYAIGTISCNYIITDTSTMYYFTIGEFDFMSESFFPFPKSLKEILHYKKLRMLE